MMTPDETHAPQPAGCAETASDVAGNVAGNVASNMEGSPAANALPPHGHPAIHATSGDISRCPFVRGFDRALVAFLGGDRRAADVPATEVEASVPSAEKCAERARDNNH